MPLFTVEYVPPPQPEPGHYVVRAPADSRGNPLFPVLHLSEEEALDLHWALTEVLFWKEAPDGGESTPAD